MKSATGELVINILLPLMMYLSPFFSAFVAMLMASEPALGSVMPRQPIHSPVQDLGRTYIFCSSEALRRKLSKQRVWLAPTVMERALLTRAIVSYTRSVST